jgi:hypothetical protein
MGGHVLAKIMPFAKIFQRVWRLAAYAIYWRRSKSLTYWKI